jgi:tetratricopeptide (TPR) repeat protein
MSGWLLRLLPVIVALLAHLPALRHEFLLWDDPSYVTDNPVIQKLDAHTLRSLFDPTTHTLHAWTPTTLLTYAVELRAAGPDPRVFHGTNLLLHAANALLVGLLLERIGLGRVGAAVGASLFAAHPLHVESVAWVSGRKDLLAAGLALGSILVYLRRTTGGRWASVALFAMGLGAKASAAVVPLLLLALHGIRRERPSRGEAVVLAFMGLGLVARGWLEVTSQAYATAGATALGLFPRLGAMVGVLGRYVRRWVLPTDLAAVYPLQHADGGTVLTGVLLGAALLAALWMARGRPVLQIGLLWWPVALLPALNVVAAPYLEADRYQSLALVGPAVWVGWMGERVWRRTRVGAGLLGTAALLGLGVGSHAVHAHWRTTESFLESQLARNPDWWEGRLLRGVWHLEGGRLERAEREARVVGEAVPGFARVPLLRARIAAKRGNLERAAAWGEGAVALDPLLTPGWAHLCTIRAMQADTDRAIPACRRALVLDRHQPAVLRTLAAVYVTLGNEADESGRTGEALEHYAQALVVEPNLPETHYNLAVTLHRAGRLDTAVVHYERALAARPHDVDTLTQMAGALRRMGELERSRKAFEKSLAVEPTGVEARYGLAALLASTGRLEEARAQLQQLLAMHPERAEAGRALTRIEQELAKKADRATGQ